MSGKFFGDEPYGPPDAPSYGDVRREVEVQLESFEQTVIRHVELATGLKHIIVDGESRYISQRRLQVPP